MNFRHIKVGNIFCHNHFYANKAKQKIVLRNKLCFSLVCACSVMSDSLQPHGLYPPGSSVHGDSPGKDTRMYCHALLQGIFPPQRLKPSLPEFNSLPSEPLKKPKNAEVGRLFLLQGNFRTQESNWGLLHCRRILYQLSLPENPIAFFLQIFCLSANIILKFYS